METDEIHTLYRQLGELQTLLDNDMRARSSPQVLLVPVESVGLNDLRIASFFIGRARDYLLRAALEKEEFAEECPY